MKAIALWVIMLGGMLAIIAMVILERQEMMHTKNGNMGDDFLRWPQFQNNVISFYYPPQWKRSETRIQSIGSVVEFELECPPNGWSVVSGPIFFLTIAANYSQITGKPYKSLDEYLEVRDVKAESINIDGFPARRFRYPSNPKSLATRHEEVIVIVEEDMLVSFLFRGTVPEEYFDKAIEDWFEPLLSSVKFIL